MVDFTEGSRYADFDSKTDKVAEYGIAALVAGGTLAAAAKLGLLKGLWIFILAAKKFIIIGVIAVVAFFKKVFRRKNNSAAQRDWVDRVSCRFALPSSILFSESAKDFALGGVFRYEERNAKSHYEKNHLSRHRFARAQARPGLGTKWFSTHRIPMVSERELRCH